MDIKMLHLKKKKKGKMSQKKLATKELKTNF